MTNCTKKAELADIYKKELDARDSRTTAETDTNESWPASSQEKKPKLLESKDLLIPATQFKGNGVVANSTPYINSDSESEKDLDTSSRIYNPEQITANLALNQGLDEPLEKDVPLYSTQLHENSPPELKKISKNSTEQRLAEATETEASASSTPDGEANGANAAITTDNSFVNLLWQRNKGRAATLLKLLRHSPNKFRWTEDGTVYLNGKKIRSNLRDILPPLFQKPKKPKPLPPDMKEVLIVLCQLQLESYVLNDNLIRDTKFKWYFLNF